LLISSLKWGDGINCISFRPYPTGYKRNLFLQRQKDNGVTQREFPASPLVGVGAVVVDKAGRVLLIRRGTEPRKGEWSIPGGLIELGEPLREGVIREVAEETGLIVTPEAIVEVIDRIYRVNDDADAQIRYHYVVVDYWCRVIGGELNPSSDASEVAWVSRAEWIEKNVYSLETITVQVIEKGWQMAQKAGFECSQEDSLGGCL
jgi:8-oxo-dGTP diphosphatase